MHPMNFDWLFYLALGVALFFGENAIIRIRRKGE